MNAQRFCAGCKHLTEREHWTRRGRGMAAFCNHYDEAVRNVKLCEFKESILLEKACEWLKARNILTEEEIELLKSEMKQYL